MPGFGLALPAVTAAGTLLALLPLAAAQGPEPAPLWPYSETTARAFATLTQASYCDEGADRQALLEWECPECREAGFELDPSTTRFVERQEIWQPNSTFAMISRLRLTEPKALMSDDGCVVSVRGSETLTNWIRDLQFWRDPVAFEWCDGCFVEDGFYTVTKSLMVRLVPGLQEIGCVPEQELSKAGPGATSSLYFTGHSLGAAVSTLAMCLLQVLGFRVKLSHIFESPRVGNHVFASVFDQEFTRKIPVFRMTYNKDPVPHLPPKRFGFRHVNYEVHYDKHGGYTICPEAEDRRCADRYPLLGFMTHGSDHCTNPLGTRGSICYCPWVDPPKVQQELLV